MITCPRCGWQAPDGSPWCPNCGYGAPQINVYYQLPPQQPQQLPPRGQGPAQYQQMPVYELPQQQPDPQPKKKAKKGKGCLKIILLVLGVLIGLFIAFMLIPSPNQKEPTSTPSIETLVGEVNTSVALSATPTATATNTPIPSYTPTPTIEPTMTPTDLPYGYHLHTVQENENCFTIAQNHGIDEATFLYYNSMDICRISIGDQVIVPDYATPVPAEVPIASAPQTYTDNSAVVSRNYLGSTVQDTSDSCAYIKGSNKGKYHCKNSPNYNTMKDYTIFCSEAEAKAAGYEMSGNMNGWCQQ